MLPNINIPNCVPWVDIGEGPQSAMPEPLENCCLTISCSYSAISRFVLLPIKLLYYITVLGSKIDRARSPHHSNAFFFWSSPFRSRLNLATVIGGARSCQQTPQEEATKNTHIRHQGCDKRQVSTEQMNSSIAHNSGRD